MLAAKKKQLEIHNKLLFPNINKENSLGGGPGPQPKLKIADLSHNLINIDNGYNQAEQQNARLSEAQRQKHAIRSNNGVSRKEGSPGNISMSPHQQYLLQQMFSSNA